jgi:hypothetical protein
VKDGQRAKAGRSTTSTGGGRRPTSSHPPRPPLRPLLLIRILQHFALS